MKIITMPDAQCPMRNDSVATPLCRCSTVKKLRILICGLLLLAGALAAQGQLYTGMSGLVKNPSADMNPAGEAVIAGYFMNRHFTPDARAFYYDGKKYDTYDFSFAITPFSWMELSYSFTLMKTLADGHDKPRYNHKDRNLSIKFRPLKEGKYWPAIAIGANDVLSNVYKENASENGGNNTGYFCNIYIVATKHFIPKGQDIGVSLGYRYVPVAHSKKWQGVVAGATWQPKWVPQLRLVGEWTGNEVNVGVDCLLWKHLFLQFAMVGCKYPTGGIAYCVNLF